MSIREDLNMQLHIKKKIDKQAAGPCIQVQAKSKLRTCKLL